ncbi:hypothetical protein J6590_057952 [Homalodisca vitripennis]|nr:hypothetical protein J6590_057952 [Homalodisca vitripennis]
MYTTSCLILGNNSTSPDISSTAITASCSCSLPSSIFICVCYNNVHYIMSHPRQQQHISRHLIHCHHCFMLMFTAIKYLYLCVLQQCTLHHVSSSATTAHLSTSHPLPSLLHAHVHCHQVSLYVCATTMYTTSCLILGNNSTSPDISSTAITASCSCSLPSSIFICVCYNNVHYIMSHPRQQQHISRHLIHCHHCFMLMFTAIKYLYMCVLQQCTLHHVSSSATTAHLPTSHPLPSLLHAHVHCHQVSLYVCVTTMYTTSCLILGNNSTSPGISSTAITASCSCSLPSKDKHQKCED